MKIPTRYKEIRDFIDGLHTANVLVQEAGSISFLHSEDYWYSHICFNDLRNKERFFNVVYMKNVDKIYVSSNLYNLKMSTNFDKWLKNTLCYDLKMKGFKVQDNITRIASIEGYSHVIKIELNKEHNYSEVYDVYKLFNRYDQILMKEV